MRRIGLLRGLVFVVALLGAPSGRTAAAQASPDLPIVLGRGNRLSGRVPARVVGREDLLATRALREFAAALGRRGTFELAVEATPTLVASASSVPLVVFGRRPSSEEAGRIRELLRGRSCVVGVLGADTAADLPAALTNGAREITSLHAGDRSHPLLCDLPRADPKRPGFLGVTFDGDDTCRLFAAPNRRSGLDSFLVFLLRHTILNGGGVRYVPTAFARVAGDSDGNRLTLALETALPGDVTLAVMDIAGEPIVPDGPAGPIELARIPDFERALIRLRFRHAAGLTDEARISLRDLLPSTRHMILLRGPRRLPVGEPLRMRIESTRPDGEPIANLAVHATSGAHRIRTTTDRTGSAWLDLPPFVAEQSGTRRIAVRVSGPHFEQDLSATVEVTPRPRGLLVETDRPVHRPGGLLQVRAFAIDGISHRARSGESIAIAVHDPLNRLIAERSIATGDFGEAVVALPLSNDLAEGLYGVRVTAGNAQATASFRVEELVRPRFRVRTVLARDRFAADEPIRGTVHAETFSGAPLEGAAVRLELRANRPPERVRFLTLDAAGRAEFSIDPLAEHASSRLLLVSVNCHGAVVSRSLPVPVQPPRRTRTRDDPSETSDVRTTVPALDSVSLDVASGTLPGSTLPVSIRSARRTGIVYLDLCTEGRFLGGASVALENGEARTDVRIPDDFQGPALLVARWSDRGDRPAAQRRIDVVTAPLDVSLTADRSEARPGDTVQCTAQVRDARGHGIPALLDVRGFDRAYREAVGELETPLGKRVVSPERDVLPAVLDRFEPAASRARLAVQARRIARPALEAARTVVADGEDVHVVLPWGAPVECTRVGETAVLSGEPAVTMNPTGVDTPLLPGPAAVSCAAAGGPYLPVRTLLPWPALDTRRKRPTGDLKAGDEDDWLGACQAADGSFPVLATRALLDLEPGESPGDPWLEPGTTGLALLAYLGAGYTPRVGKHKHIVASALKHLESIRNEAGFIGDPKAPWALLNHAICTAALAEAYGMTNEATLGARATAALQALLARQREDGGFGEAGFREASLVLTGWSSFAIQAARSAEISVPQQAIERVSQWVDARTDPKTGCLPAGTDEIQCYPFPGTGSTRYSAAITAEIRILLLRKDPEKDPALLRIQEILLSELPDAADRDLHGTYWATMAMFQFGGSGWARWNRAMRRAVIDTRLREGAGRGSWPADGYTGRVATSACGILCLEIYYRYGKVFGGPGSRGLETRSHFPDLLLADLARPTGAEGRTTIRLPLPDSITHWDVLVGAWDGRGGYGVARTTVRATLPLHLDVDLPERLHEGDKIRLPVRVHSTLAQDASVTLRVVHAEGLALAGKGTFDANVPAGGTVAVPIPLEAAKRGPARLVLEVAGDGHCDAIEHTAEILPVLPIHAVATRVVCSQPLRPGSVLRPGETLPDDATSIRGRLRVTTGPLGEAAAGLEALIHRPTGCFEQTTATLYPALLALQYLGKTGRVNAEVDARARRHLSTGYQAVLGYEVAGGGFSLYGKAPADAELTALGLHLLADLKQVQAVDEAVMARAATFLQSHMPDGLTARIYALAALSRCGRTVGTSSAVRQAFASRDPYAVALAACHGLIGEAEAAKVKTLLEKTVEIWSGRQNRAPRTPTLFTGGTIHSRTETAALAVHALSRLGGSTELIDRGLLTIRHAMGEDGGWATTRETVVCLRALLATAPASPARGVVVAKRSGKPDRRLAIGAPTLSSALDLGELERDEPIGISFEGTGTPVISAVLEALSESAVEAGPFTLAVRWQTDVPAPGAPACCWIHVCNRSDRRVHAPHIEVPIPGGFRPDRTALAEDAAAAGAGRVEVKAGRIQLYLYALERNAEVQVRIPFVASVSGRFHTGAVRAWPYYAPQDVSLFPGTSIHVATGK